MSTKCTECGAYKGHSPLCSLNTPEETKAHLETYFQAYQEFRKRFDENNTRYQRWILQARKEAEFWKGKFNTLKVENNALRKKK